MKFQRFALCTLELEGRSEPLPNSLSFWKVYAYGPYYEPHKIVIADVKCTMKTSFLHRFVSLGDQGDPAESPKPPCLCFA